MSDKKNSDKHEHKLTYMYPVSLNLFSFYRFMFFIILNEGAITFLFVMCQKHEIGFFFQYIQISNFKNSTMLQDKSVR